MAVPYDCGCLWDRHSDRFKRFSKLHVTTPDEASELQAWVNTPGFKPIHFRKLMGWTYNPTINVPVNDDLVHANVAGMDDDDAQQLFELLDPHNWHTAMPYWVIMWLKKQRCRDVGKRYSIPASRIEAWRRADIYDPLTGVWRGKPKPILKYRPTV